MSKSGGITLNQLLAFDGFSFDDLLNLESLPEASAAPGRSSRREQRAIRKDMRSKCDKICFIFYLAILRAKGMNHTEITTRARKRLRHE